MKGRSLFVVATAAVSMVDVSMAFSMKRPTKTILTSNAPVTIDIAEGQTSLSKVEEQSTPPQPITTDDMQSFSHRGNGEFGMATKAAKRAIIQSSASREATTKKSDQDDSFGLDIDFIDDPTDMDVFIRNEYNKWLQYHNKEADESRYPSFKENFLNQLKHDIQNAKKEGKSKPQFFHLNEYGDMTPDEYQQEMATLKSYENWCQAHGRPQDPAKYAIFKDNFKVVQESKAAAVADSADSGENNILEDKDGWMALTEYADLTEEQFSWLTTDELFLKHRYAKWLQDYGKDQGLSLIHI